MATAVLSCGLDRTAICEQFRPLVRKTIQQLHVPASMFEDAEQDGMVALLKAFDNYDQASPAHFGVYAKPYVKGAILRSLFRKGESEAATSVVPVGDVVDLENIEAQMTTLDGTDDEVERFRVRQWLTNLSQRDRWLIFRKYWQDARTAEIARELGTSVHWVNERHRILLGRAYLTLAA